MAGRYGRHGTLVPGPYRPVKPKFAAMARAESRQGVGVRGGRKRAGAAGSARVVGEPALHRVKGQLEAVGDAELAVDAGEVVFDRLLADGVLPRHVLVAEAG